MRIKDFIFELQVVIMTLILAFAEFAPVGTNVAMIGYFLAFGIGAVNTVIIISSEIKNRNFIAGVLITLAVSLVLVFEGYYSKGIVILAAIIVVKSQVKLLKKRCCETIDGMKGILPEKTTVFTNGIEGELSCRDLEKGNVTVVKRGQRIPTDGIVFAGKTILDEKVLIGGGSNSDARTVKSGDSVFAGSINLGEEVQIESISTQKDSLMGQVVDRILRVDVNSSEVFLKLKKIVSAAKYFAVIFGVVLISIWIFFMGYEYKSALYWGSFALLLANVDIATDFIEVGMKKFIIRNAKNGIIPKDLDQGNNAGFVDRVIVESNDMYLGGAYKLVKIHSDGVVSKEEMLVYAAHLENEIDHPIATAVKKAFLQLAKYEKISPQDAIRTGLIDKVEYIKEEAGRKNVTSEIEFREHNEKINIKITPIYNNEHFGGINLKLDFPRFIKTNNYVYCIDDEYLSRCDTKTLDLIKALRISDFGYQNVKIGRKNIGRFYSKVLPIIKDSAIIKDEAPEAIEYVPEEANITFYLDMEDGNALGKVEASYSGGRVDILSGKILETTEEELLRDAKQENKAVEVLKRFMPDDSNSGCLLTKTEDELYELKVSGIDFE